MLTYPYRFPKTSQNHYKHIICKTRSDVWNGIKHHQCHLDACKSQLSVARWIVTVWEGSCTFFASELALWSAELRSSTCLIFLREGAPITVHSHLLGNDSRKCWPRISVVTRVSLHTWARAQAHGPPTPPLPRFPPCSRLAQSGVLCERGTWLTKCFVAEST